MSNPEYRGIYAYNQLAAPSEYDVRSPKYRGVYAYDATALGEISGQAPSIFLPTQWRLLPTAVPGELVLHIDELPNNGGLEILYVQFHTSGNPGGPPISIGVPEVGAYTIALLTPGQPVSLAIRASNIVGDGDWSAPKVATPADYSVPGVVTAGMWALSNAAGNGNLLVVLDDLPANGGTPINTFQYKVGAAGAARPLPYVGEDNYVLTAGLTAGTPADIYIRLGNSVGLQPTWSDMKTATPPAAATAPAQPTTNSWRLDKTEVPGQLSLKWDTLPGNGGSAITALGYRIAAGAEVILAGLGTGERLINNLPAGATTVSIRATNAIGAGAWSANKTATPQTGTLVTGGDITTYNGNQVHEFLTNDILTIQGDPIDLHYEIAGGGGAGGMGRGGGGGAGELERGTDLAVVAAVKAITVGIGGISPTVTNNLGGNGGDTVYNLHTAKGGGGGSGVSATPGSVGGSGGGGRGGDTGVQSAGGAAGVGANTTAGGAGNISATATQQSSGGGGGAGGPGGNGTNTLGGAGGNGLLSGAPGKTDILCGGGGGLTNLSSAQGGPGGDASLSGGRGAGGFTSGSGQAEDGHTHGSGGGGGPASGTGAGIHSGDGAGGVARIWFAIPAVSTADVLVTSGATLLTALNAVPVNLGRLYTIDCAPGNYGTVTLASGYTKGTTRVRVRGQIPATPPLFRKFSAIRAVNMELECLNFTETSRDVFGYPGPAIALHLDYAKKIKLRDLFLYDVNIGIQWYYPEESIVEYVTIAGYAIDGLRWYATTGGLLRDCILRCCDFSALSPVGTTWPDISADYADAANLSRRCAIDPRRSHEAAAGASKFVLNLAGVSTEVTYDTLRGRHPDLFQIDGLVDGLLVEDCRFTTANVYSHGHFQQVETGKVPDLSLNAMNMTYQRCHFHTAHVHAINFTRTLAPIVKDTLISTISPATWTASVGLRTPGISCKNLGGPTGNKVQCSNVVVPANALNNGWMQAAKIDGDVTYSNTDLPTGWAGFLVPQNKIGQFGYNH